MLQSVQFFGPELRIATGRADPGVQCTNSQLASGKESGSLHLIIIQMQRNSSGVEFIHGLEGFYDPQLCTLTFWALSSVLHDVVLRDDDNATLPSLRDSANGAA